MISRTTSEPNGGRARMMVVIDAGSCSVGTFRDCHNSIAFTIGIPHSIIRAYLYYLLFVFVIQLIYYANIVTVFSNKFGNSGNQKQLAVVTNNTITTLPRNNCVGLLKTA